MDPEKLARIDAACASIEKRVDALAQRRADAGFDEGKHPRAPDGKFGSGGGGGGGKARIHESARNDPSNRYAPMKRKSGEDLNSYMARAVEQRTIRQQAEKAAAGRNPRDLRGGSGSSVNMLPGNGARSGPPGAERRASAGATRTADLKAARMRQNNR